MSLPYTGRAWTIALEPNVPLLNANERLNHWAEAQRIKDLRELAGWLARKQRIPQIRRAHIIYYVLVTDPLTSGRKRDPANWAPTAKAMVDGLVDAGILPDDAHQYLVGPDPRLAPESRAPGLVLRIKELLPDGEA